MIERVARAICPPTGQRVCPVICGECDRRARAAIEAMREPIMIEDACRAAADKRTGYICWEGISVHRAADVVDAVITAALNERPEKGPENSG